MEGGQARRRARAWSLDCEAFYRVVGRQRAELWRNGIWLPDGVQLDERCCFGDASAATKCSRISNFLVFHIRKALDEFDSLHPTQDTRWMEWQRQRAVTAAAAGEMSDEVKRHSALFWIGMFIDDQMAGSADDLLFDLEGKAVCAASGEQQRRAKAHFELARQVLERFGWNSSESKECPPTLTITVLGVEIIMQENRWRISGDKRSRYAEQAKAMATSRFAE